MSEIVTIYKINCFSSPEPGQEGESCSLLPWRNLQGLHGKDDGGRDYSLPDGYSVGITDGGEPAIFSEEETVCELMLHNGCPLLVDSRKRRAYLLEPVKKITSYRELAGMTLSDLAQRLSVEPKQLYEWENLEKEPSEEIISKIASVLGCSPSELE